MASEFRNTKIDNSLNFSFAGSILQAIFSSLPAWQSEFTWSFQNNEPYQKRHFVVLLFKVFLKSCEGFLLKFIYSEKATKFCENSTVALTGTT